MSFSPLWYFQWLSKYTGCLTLHIAYSARLNFLFPPPLLLSGVSVCNHCLSFSFQPVSPLKMAFADWCREHQPSSHGAEAWALWQLIPLLWMCVTAVLSSAFWMSFLCFMCPPHQMVTKVVCQLQTSYSVVHFLMQNQDSLNHSSTSFVAPWWILPKGHKAWATERSGVPSCVTPAPMSDTQTSLFTMAVAPHSGTHVGSSF